MPVEPPQRTNTTPQASPIITALAEDQANAAQLEATALLGALIQSEQYVGEICSINYETAVVQIHDLHRQRVGGIPNQCFLIATRIAPRNTIDYTLEDSSVVLLRVLDAASLPGDQEANRIRAEAAQRVSGSDVHWDDQTIMDAYTANFLSFAGVKCRVIGTFFVEQDQSGSNGAVTLKFGSDLSNYYPNRGLKVYKPNNEALNAIVNYRERVRVNDHPLGHFEVHVGRVRYASTDRGSQGIDTVRVHLAPADLLSQKTALFGMTRTGKSNTTKIIAKSIFELRFQNESGRVGQLIFDYNGEYANENIQDASDNANPNALKNVWQTNPAGQRDDVVTYGSVGHPLDPNRRLMRINFYGENLRSLTDAAEIERAFRMVQVGKEIINHALEDERGSARYITNFLDLDMTPPDPTDGSAFTRYRRAVLAYRTLLYRAGFPAPAGLQPSTVRLFNPQILNALANSRSDPQGTHALAAQVFGTADPTWAQLADAFDALRDFISRGTDTGYLAFNQQYIQNSSTGSPWHDQRLEKIIEMFHWANGPRLIGRVLGQHASDRNEDYTDAIYADLVAGRLVIVDQSAGDVEINRRVADRVMRKIFSNNQRRFSRAELPPEILVYIEEAQNLLPAGSEEDFQNIWVKSAKEGAKLRIGLVYATQEVSSIQKNILKNTANWFIGHLNNTDETKELTKYYDFEDFEPSIRRAQDRGFLRVKTLSNLFVVPVQIDRFSI
jgi:uncharacterized protein DUF87